MNFAGGALAKSRVNFMIDHNFVDPKLLPYWQNSCENDPQSAGCGFFNNRYEDLLFRTNPYNIYGVCSNHTLSHSLSEQNNQASFLLKLSDKLTGSILTSRYDYCSYDDGIIDYFNKNSETFIGKNISTFQLCNNDIFNIYEVTQLGVMDQLPKLISNTNITIHYVTGDWDGVVPFTDTVMNFKKIGLSEDSFSPWTMSNQNVGTKRVFVKSGRSVLLWMVKKAGHEVPMYQRQASQEIFQQFLNASSKAEFRQ